VVERCLGIGGGLFILFDKKTAVGTAWVTCDGRRMAIHYFGIFAPLSQKLISKSPGIIPVYQHEGCGLYLMKVVLMCI